MGIYADAHLSNSELEDYGNKECYFCLGTGMICLICEESSEYCCCQNGSGFKSCTTCDGTGTIIEDADDRANDEWDSECED